MHVAVTGGQVIAEGLGLKSISSAMITSGVWPRAVVGALLSVSNRVVTST
jgi:hypothetical protein